MNSELGASGLALMCGLVAAAGLCGCGGSTPERAEVSGSVSVRSEPLEAGVIRFVPQKGGVGETAYGMIRDGRYEISRSSGPLEGLHRVEINSSDDGGFATDDETAIERLAALPPSARPKPLRIAEEYNKATILSVEIEPGSSTTYDFDVEPAKNRRTR